MTTEPNGGALTSQRTAINEDYFPHIPLIAPIEDDLHKQIYKVWRKVITEVTDVNEE